MLTSRERFTLYHQYHSVRDSKVSMFADDTSVCHQSNDLTQLTGVINNDLRQLDTWLQGNKLCLTVAKTHIMLGCTKQKHATLKSENEDLKLKIREKELQLSEKTKYLGARADSENNLTFRHLRPSLFCHAHQIH